MSRQRRKMDRRAAGSSTKRHCKCCRRVIARKAKICSFCGRKP